MASSCCLPSALEEAGLKEKRLGLRASTMIHGLSCCTMTPCCLPSSPHPQLASIHPSNCNFGQVSFFPDNNTNMSHVVLRSTVTCVHHYSIWCLKTQEAERMSAITARYNQRTMLLTLWTATAFDKHFVGNSCQDTNCCSNESSCMAALLNRKLCLPQTLAQPWDLAPQHA